MEKYMQIEILRSLYAYNAYANRLVLDTAGQLSEEEMVRECSPSHGNVLNLLLHMMGCELYFLKTCQQQPMPQREGEKPLTLDEIRSFWEGLAREHEEYLGAVDETTLQQEVTVEFPGRFYHLPRWKFLVQAFVHSAHHRGELSIVLSGLGYPLPTLDIIIPYIEESGQAWE
jgi:uncharacterized damage-inducible protein DinB